MWSKAAVKMEIEKDNSMSQPHKKLTENPMLNELVLNTIFDFSGVSDLKMFRLVCHTWNDVAFPALKKASDCNAGAFVDVNVPVKDLSFKNFILTRPPCEFSSLNLANVWNNCGKWMTSLHVYAGRIKDLDTLRDIVYRRTPQLQHLMLNCVLTHAVHQQYRKHQPEFAPEGTTQLNMKSILVGVGRKGFPVNSVQFFRIFPNLENLRLLTRRDNVHDLTSMLNGLTILRNKDKSNYANFKGLDIIAANSKDDLHVSTHLKNFFATWEGNHVPLEMLAFDVGSLSTPGEVRNVLSVCKMTLKSLDLYRNGVAAAFYNFPFDVTFPYLKVFRTTNVACGSFEFLRFMPCLEVLHLVDVTLMNFDIYGYNDRKHQEIDELGMSYGSDLMTNFVSATVQEFYCGYGCDRRAILNFTKWMPNVRKLIMPLTLNDGGLRVICDNWTMLNYLTIVVGIRNNDIGAISKLKYLKSCVVETVNDIHDSWTQSKAKTLQLVYFKKPTNLPLAAFEIPLLFFAM